jgi:hypothetical protein
MPAPQLFYGAKPIFFRRSFRRSPVQPELVRERGDIPLVGVVSAIAGMRVEERLVGVLQGLPGAFMSGQVIFLTVLLGAAAMSMGPYAPLFGRDLLRFAHMVANARIMPSAALAG